MRPLIAMERSVNKLTSKTIKPLKPKHVQILTGASWQREIPISELFRYINHRLREDHWVITFKALITIHILMREGATDRVLGFIVSNPGLLRMHNFRDRTNTALGQEQSKNLRAYSQYLEEKVAAFKELKVDFVRSKADMIARLRSLPVEDGLLKEVELLQKQIDALLGCTFYLEEIDNVVTLQAFRLLIGDMMALFHLLNESVIRILGEYFEMSKSDAERALQIYKNFATQTTKTVEFFDIARRLKHALGMDVPAFKHAPVSLAGALEDYLKAPDFEAQRMAYKEKKGGKTGGTASASAPASKGTAATSTQSSTQPTSTSKQPEKPAIDFFSSLDDELSAFQAPAVQAQYNTAADPFGGLWGGGQDGGASAASNPFGAVQTTNPFALKNQELQQQTQDINSQLQALQAGLNTFNVQGAADPFGGGGGAGGQMVLASQGGFPMLQQQQSQSQFGGYSPFAMPQQQQQQPQGFGAGGGAFTVENVFGNNDAFGSGGGGAAPATRNNPFGGPTTAALPAPLATQQSSTDPFAGLGLPQQQPSTTNPTLDPFGLNRQPTTFGNNGMQQGAFAALQGQATGAGSLNNPFASTGQPQQQQQQPFAPRSTTTTTGFGGAPQPNNYTAAPTLSTAFGGFGSSNHSTSAGVNFGGNSNVLSGFSLGLGVGGVGGGGGAGAGGFGTTHHPNTSNVSFTNNNPNANRASFLPGMGVSGGNLGGAGAFNPFATGGGGGGMGMGMGMGTGGVQGQQGQQQQGAAAFNPFGAPAAAAAGMGAGGAGAVPFGNFAKQDSLI